MTIHPNMNDLKQEKETFASFDGLPSSLYYDPNVFQKEKEQIFYKKWIFVGHVTQITQAGQYFIAKIVEQSIIVIRGKDSQIYAFHNTCLHRGHELLQDKGQISELVCPYHAWNYRLNGTLAHAPYSHQVKGFDLSKFCLPRINLHEICGLIFVNLDVQAKPFLQEFPELEEDLRTYIPNIDQQIAAYFKEFTVKSNWKNLAENSVDNYHTPFLHPSLNVTTKMTTFKHIMKENYAFSVADIDKKEGVYEFAEKDYDEFAWLFIWPSLEVGTFPGNGMRLYRINPNHHSQTHQCFTYCFTNGMPNEQQMDCINIHLETVHKDDLNVLEGVQRGQSSLGYEKSLFMIKSDATEWDERIVYHIQQMTKKALEL